MMSILHNIIMDLNKVMWRHVAIAIQAFSLVERPETVQVHFKHEGKGLKAQRRLHGWKVYMESYVADYG